MSTQSLDNISSCYTLLGISPAASTAEIKKAYRAKLKAFHPDLNKKHETSEPMVHKLVQAFRTLMDPAIRRMHENMSTTAPFSYRDFLQEQTDPVSVTKLLFFDLLHGNEEAACELYVRSYQEGYILSRYLEREDYMDCGFMLAEELSFREQPVLAFLLLQDIIRLELAYPYFRHFFPDVLELMHTVIQVKMQQVPDDQVLAWVESILNLGLPAKDSAIWLKKAAELYLFRNQFERASFYVTECKRLFKNMTGLHDLQNKIDAHYAWRKR